MFFGARWKIGLLIGSILVGMLCFYGVIQLAGIDQHFNIQQAQRTQEYDRQWHRFIEQRIWRYQRYLSQQLSLPIWKQALENADTLILEKNIGQLLETALILDPWRAVNIYDAQGKVQFHSGDETPDAWLIKQALVSSTAHWYSHCDQQCWLWIAIPVLDERRTVLSIAVDMPSLITEFGSLNQADVMLVSVHSSSASLVPIATLTSNEVNILSWPTPVRLFSANDSLHGLVERIAFSYPFEKLANGVRYADDNGRLFWVKTFPFGAILSDQNSQQMLYLVDITDEYKEQVILAGNYIRYGLAIWAVLFPLILLLLWQPVKNLHKLNDAMRLARSESSEQLRQRILELQSPGRWLDETQQLLPGVLMLIDQRIFVQRLLQQRTELLEKRRADLEKERDFVTTLLDTAHAIILLQSSRGKIEMINRYGTKLIGKNSLELLNTSFTSLLPYREELPDIRYQLDALSKGMRDDFTHEYEFKRFDGKRIYMAWFHARLPSEDDYGYQILSIALDVSQRKHAEEYLGWLAAHDVLTGLVNRRHFADELDKILRSSLRYHQSGAVLCFDLDQFKDVNDTSGHGVGDNLLKSVARVLRKQARDTDIVARLGGDEFAMILPQADELEAAETAERLCRALNKVQVGGGKSLHYVSASIGVAIFPRQGKTVAELLMNADMAMSQAKEAGRNGWKLFADDDQTRTSVNERVYWNEMVKRTLDDDSFEMYYQPIKNLRTLTISHYEALLRIFDDQHEILSSQKFILSAEASGTIQELDMRIIARVFRHKAHLESCGIVTQLAVNLSGLSFKNIHLVEHIESLYQRYQIDRSSIIFEITETAAVSDAKGTQETMSIIKKSGYRFSLDDFGVGFSSLYYLKKFPFDYVKIDGSFVRNLTEDLDDQVLVKALVEVAKSFGQFTIAEYVETSECCDLLKTLNVDYAQGYFIGRPVPAEEIWPQLQLKSDAAKTG